MPRSVTPLDSSSGTRAANSAAAASVAAAWPGVRRNTVHSVYSVSPAAGVVTASASGDEAADGAGWLEVMPSIILRRGRGSCELTEKTASLPPRVADNGCKPGSGHGFADP